MRTMLLLTAVALALLVYLACTLCGRAVHEDSHARTITRVQTVDARADVERIPPTTTVVAPTPTTMHVVARARTAPKSRPVLVTVDATVWDRIAACESGGRWDDQRGGYEGGVHFLHSTWVAAGGRRYAEHAYQATRAQQIDIADSWRRRTSWSQWPVCSRKAGVR